MLLMILLIVIFSELLFIRKRILKVINITTEEGGIGMYFGEKEDKLIKSNNQPIKLIPAIKSRRNNGDSFLLMI